MARTKYEIEALAEAIHSKITEEQAKRIKTIQPQVKKIFNKEYEPLYKKLSKTEKESKAIRQKIRKKAGSEYYTQKDTVIAVLTKKLAKIKDVKLKEVEREIILSGDSGSDIVIKNITKMFL